MSMDSTGDGSNVVDNDNKVRNLESQIVSEVLKLMELVEGNPDLMAAWLIDLKKLTLKYRTKVLNSSSIDGKLKVFEQFYGDIKIPDKITVFPPAPIKITKETRLKMKAQELTYRYTKPKRRCSKCKQMTNMHDARNCGKVKEDPFLKYAREIIDGTRKI